MVGVASQQRARRVQRVELLQDQASVGVDVAADGEDGDAAVGNAQGRDVDAREGRRLDLSASVRECFIRW